MSLTLSYWLLTQSLNKKEGQQIESLALSEASAISQALVFYTEEIKKALLNAHFDKGLMSYGPFLALTELSYENSKLSIEEFRNRSSKLDRNSFKQKLSEIPIANADIKDQLNFHYMELSANNEFIFVFYKSKNSILGGFLEPNDISSLLDAKQTSDHRVFVLANKTKAIVHPEKKYLGSNVDNHPLSQLALNNKHFSGVQTKYENADEKLVLSFEIVPRTNLTVGVVHSLTTGGYLSYINWTELIMGFAILVIAMFLIFSVVLLPLEKTLIYFRTSLNQLVRGEPLSQPEGFMSEAKQLLPTLETLQSQLDEVEVSHRLINPSQKEESSAVVSETEKYVLFKNFSLNLAQVISNPLNALLGHLQMAKVGPDHHTTQMSIDLAQKETRKVRALLDDLSLAVKDSEILFKPVLLDDVINDMLREKLKIFNDKGIKVHKNFQSKKFIRSQQMNLEKALSLIFNFLIANFTEQVLRDLSFSTQDNHNEVLFKIQSNSDSLTVEQVHNLLEPYSQEISGIEDLLSLSIANALIKHLEGVIKVSSATSGELCLEIYLPVASEHEVQNYIDEQKSTEGDLEDLTKDEILEVLSGEVKNEEESFSGFETEEYPEDEFYVSSEPKKEVRTSIRENSEPSIRLSQEISDMEKESAIEFVSESSMAPNSSSDIELPEDDFVMVKPPKASEISPPLKKVTDPYLSPNMKVLSDKTPLLDGELAMPEIPRVRPLTNNLNEEEDKDLVVNIRRPKLRSDN